MHFYTFGRASISGGLLLLLSLPLQANVSGTVFRDFNANGTKDSNELGVAGVTVNAYDANNALLATATSGATGSYTLSGVTGDVRIAFTNTPSYLYPGAMGSAGQSSEQFVTAGSSTTVNYALNAPHEYCQAAPLLMTPRYINGAANGAGLTEALLAWPYANTGTSTTGLQTRATRSEIGSVWGVAYQRSNNSVFTAAVLKRHVGVKDNDGDGVGDLGAIYKTDLTTNTTSLFVSIPNAGSLGGTEAARGLGASSSANADTLALSKVMKVGLGDIDISDDEKYLYVTNLNTKKLYQIDIAQQTVVNNYTIPTPCDTSKGNNRPFAVGYYQGNAYVGLVCDAAISGLKSDLAVYVERLNSDGSFTQVLQSSLNYTKEAAATANAGRAGWYGWSDDYNVISIIYGGARRVVYPQPVLSDIDFDKNGNMILGFIDRAGFQGGFENTAPQSMPTTGTQEFITINGGELLKATASGGTWSLGLNDFYNDDSPVADHQESAVGGVCYSTLNDQVITTSMDPTGNTHSGGITNLNNATGARNSGFQLFRQDNGNPDLFGKGTGLGDLELLCDPAPIEVGNRVWLDSNGNGLQDAGEAGIPNVTVKLLNGSTEIASATTAADGSYGFSNGSGTSTSSKIYGISALKANTQYTLQFPTSVAVAGTDYALTQINASTNTLLDSNVATTGEATIQASDIPAPGANNHSFDAGYTTNTATASNIDLKLSKTVDKTNAKPGDEVTYTLTLTNESTNDATNVQITDHLPTAITLLSSVASHGSYTASVWDVGTLTAGTSATLSMTVRIQ